MNKNSRTPPVPNHLEIFKPTLPLFWKKLRSIKVSFFIPKKFNLPKSAFCAADKILALSLRAQKQG